jgi:hypothetical protein
LSGGRLVFIENSRLYREFEELDALLEIPAATENIRAGSYVSFERNTYTEQPNLKQPNLMATMNSDLHQQIQDTCNEAGVEIMSPQDAAVRDGNQTTLRETYLPPSYLAPSFRILPTPGGGLMAEPAGRAGERNDEGRYGVVRFGSDHCAACFSCRLRL